MTLAKKRPARRRLTMRDVRKMEAAMVAERRKFWFWVDESRDQFQNFNAKALEDQDGNVVAYGGECEWEGQIVVRCPADAYIIKAARQLFVACKAQHEAIDRLFARLIALDPDFLPTKSGQPWDAVLMANEALDVAAPPKPKRRVP